MLRISLFLKGASDLKYVLRRILALIITMVMVSFLAFAAFQMISGDPAQAILGTNATPERLVCEDTLLGAPFFFFH